VRRADLARLRGHLLELGRLAEGAGALAEAQEATQALAAVGALCVTLRRTAADAQEWAAGIDVGPPGLLTTGEV
jgi:hypothetical protein